MAKLWNEMISVLDHDSALWGYTGPGTTGANGMKFVMNYAPDAGSIATCWPAVQRITTVPHMPPGKIMKIYM